MQLNLSSGQPPSEFLPSQIVLEATSRLFGFDMSPYPQSSPILSYGDNTSFFSRRVAHFLSTECQRSQVDSNLIVPTAGVSNALDMICTMLCKDVRKTPVVFVEDSSYYLSMSIFEDHKLHICSLPTNSDGIIIDIFQMILEALLSSDSFHPLFVYTIPTFHNPTGRSMPLKSRIELLRLTKQYGVYIVCDEVY